MDSSDIGVLVRVRLGVGVREDDGERAERVLAKLRERALYGIIKRANSGEVDAVRWLEDRGLLYFERKD